MVENNTNNTTPIKMIEEFEKQLNNFYNAYQDKKITFEKCTEYIHNLIAVWNNARIDIKNNGTENNRIEFLEYEQNVNIAYPSWFKDAQGQGSKIQYSKKNTSIVFKCNNKGNMEITFRGLDFRNIDGNRIPIYINYKNVKINDRDIINEEKLVWHNQPYVYTKKCLNEEMIKLDVVCETIFDFFPLLATPLSNIKDVNDLHESINDTQKYINNEKLSIQIKDLNLNNSISNINSQIPGVIDDNISINLLNKKNEELSQQFEEYKRNTDAILNSYNTLFNNLFIYHKVEPKKIVKYSRTLNIELLNFIDNVCKKYDLKWWLYAGTLLGAIRHEGFIPWDDDCDINMLRKDYEKFYQIIDEEIEKHDLNGFFEVNTNTITNNDAYLPFIKVNYWVEGDLFGFIDIFPTDYVNDIIPDIESVFKQEHQRITWELRNGSDRTQTLNESFKKLHVTDEKTSLLMSGVDDPILCIYDYDTIFPLSTIKFEEKLFPCPRDYKKYISTFYDETYMKMPKVVYNHGFYEYLSRHNNVYSKFETEIDKLRKINKNF